MGRRNNGEGSIYKRKDGRWCAAVSGQDCKRHYIYGASRSEVRDKMSRMEKNLRFENSKLELKDWIRDYLENYRHNDLKASTYSGYMMTYRKHIRDSELGKIPIGKIRTSDIQNYYNGKIKDGYSAKTIRQMRVLIKASLDMAVRLHWISENPERYTCLPKKQRYEAKILSAEEVEKIYMEGKDSRIYPIVITALFSGLRKGEIMALKWSDCDFENSKIYVRSSLGRSFDDVPDEKGRYHARYAITEPKTKKSIRTVPMLEEVKEALLAHRISQESDRKKYAEIYCDYNLVFSHPDGNLLPQRRFMDDYHDFLEQCGVKRIRFHDLRHTFASMLLDEDVSLKVVQEILGHTTITTSMDLYTHVSESKKENALKRIGIKKEYKGA